MKERTTATPLEAIIKAAIAAEGRRGEAPDGLGTPPGTELSAISFHHYMSLCLYHPDYGYYRGGVGRVGREGDFYTSAYVGEAMGEQLADAIVRLADERFPDGEPVAVVDWGGGTGRLSRHMLDAWAAAGATGDRFSLTLVDGSPEHRREAGERLEPYIRAGRAQVIGGEPEALRDGGEGPVVVVANELLDAFPVHRVVKSGGLVREWGVTWDEREGAFAPCLLKKDGGGTDWAVWLREQGVALREGQTFEICPDAAAWIRSLGDRVRRGALILIDYGDEQQELASAHRMAGTLMCYAKHRAHDDPYLTPGEQDITAHVDFSHMRRAASASGWRESWYGTQKRFLVESGILAKLSEHQIADPFHPVARRNRAIRQLLLSDGMSELFKVQIFIRTI